MCRAASSITIQSKNNGDRFIYQVGNRTVCTIIRVGATTSETYIYPSDSNKLQRIDILQGATSKQRAFLYDLNGNLTQETRANGALMKPNYDATNRMDSVQP